MTEAAQVPQSESQPTGKRTGWFAMVLVGSIMTMLTGALFAASVAIAASVSSHQGGSYLLSPQQQFSSPAYAVTTPSAAFETSLQSLPEIRIVVTAESTNENPIFVGIAASADVADYLSQVHSSEINGAWGLPPRAQLRDVPGSDRPEPPEAQDFWSAESAVRRSAIRP